MARMGHGCSILSEREDKELSHKFCSMAYAEAQYIAFNKYGHADLMLELSKYSYNNLVFFVVLFCALTVPWMNGYGL